MGILQPETGLLFWMCISFGVVLLALAKFAFPVILRAIDSRRNYIDTALGEAREAEERLATVEDRARRIAEGAEAERTAILVAAAAERDNIISEARERASAESERIVAAAKSAAAEEREEILRDARRQVGLLALAVSERLLREKLADTKEQSQLVERLLDEMEANRKIS